MDPVALRAELLVSGCGGGRLDGFGGDAGGGLFAEPDIAA
jgi:hypothetical protein